MVSDKGQPSPIPDDPEGPPEKYELRVGNDREELTLKKLQLLIHQLVKDKGKLGDDEIYIIKKMTDKKIKLRTTQVKKLEEMIQNDAPLGMKQINQIREMLEG